ncbi:MAG: DEAD/DEAH box helicase [Desulfobacteraceae bacterium]|nr:MAG: DEAD/DEAH box helicase [Desulfobacteraceae bacterium]
MSFETLGLKPELLHSVTDMGFTAPMPIQEKAIPTLLSGQTDFVGLAQTGTGKTGAFGLPLLQLVDAANPQPQGIVLCPTRELCMQITDDLTRFAAHLKGIRVVAVYGGASIANQLSQIKRCAQIIVATPGRLIDLIGRKGIRLSEIAYAVLDEADEMLNMGFLDDINEILSMMPPERNIWLFSATMPPGVATIARKYLDHPVEITLGARNASPELIAHHCYVLHEKNKYEGLKRIIDMTPDIFGLVFCRTRKDTQAVAEKLIKDGYPAEALHGELSQSQRDYVMRKFRQGTVRVLVATDVAARGLDVDDITHVVHYNLPDEPDVYTHRSGRTARAGKSGASMVLAGPRDLNRIREIEKRRNIQFMRSKLPDGQTICETQLVDMVKKIVGAEVNHAAMADYLPAVYTALEGFDREEIIQRFVAAEFNRIFKNYRHARDINASTESRPAKTVKPGKPLPARPGVRPGPDKTRSRLKKIQRVLINVGRMDKVNEGAILRLICDQSGIKSGMVGAIDLNREFSFFEVEKNVARRVINSVNNTSLDGRVVRVKMIDN